MGGVVLPSFAATTATWPLISTGGVWWSEPVFLDTPVEGWRAWGVDTSGVLRSITYPHVWGDGSVDARCSSTTMADRVHGRRELILRRLRERRSMGVDVDARIPDRERAPRGHLAPHEDCGCGYWLFKTPDVMANNHYEFNRWMRAEYTGWLVTGQVRAWGNAVEHENGWRAQYAEAFGEVEIHKPYSGINPELLRFLAEKIREKNRVTVNHRESGRLTPVQP